MLRTFRYFLRLTQIYRLNLETVRLKILRLPSHEAATATTTRRLASAALVHGLRRLGRSPREKNPMVPFTKRNQLPICASGWMLSQRKVLSSAPKHSKLLLSHGGCSKEGSMTSRGSLSDPRRVIHEGCNRERSNSSAGLSLLLCPKNQSWIELGWSHWPREKCR